MNQLCSRGNHSNGQGEDPWPRDVVDRIEREKSAEASLKQYAKLIAEECAPIAGHGDGNCGHILRTIEAALEKAGLYSADAEVVQPAGYTKKQISHDLQKRVFERDAYRCLHCGTHLDLCADHIQPESKGGATELDNLQTLCRPCNSRKGSRQ